MVDIVISNNNGSKLYAKPGNFRYLDHSPFETWEPESRFAAQRIEYDGKIYYCIDKLLFLPYFPDTSYGITPISDKNFPKHVIFVDNILKFVGFENKEDFLYWAMILL